MAKPPKKTPYYIDEGAINEERRHQNGGVVLETVREGANGFRRRHRARFEMVLDAYLWHGKIGEAEYRAGQKFAREYARSVLKIKIYDGSGAHGDREMATLSAINGNTLLARAFEVLSPPQRSIIISVCVDNYPAPDGGRVRLLQRALKRLAWAWNT